MSDGFEIAKAYSKGELCGWAEKTNPGLAKEAFDLLSKCNEFVPFHIRGKSAPTSGRRASLFHLVRAVLGKDTDNYPQAIGDCVSFGAKNAVEYLTCAQILGKALRAEELGLASAKEVVAAARIKWRPVFPPYFYGTGRVYVGGGRIRGDGSLGSWMATAVKKYGTLFADEPGVPKYSGSIARAWGDSDPRPDLDHWVKTATEFPVKSAALVTTWDQLMESLSNGYPVTTASDIGYSMEPGRDGFHVQNDTWAHQMMIYAGDETYKNGEEPYALILNNWGDVHGRLKDFHTGEDLPVGTLRVRRKDVEKHLRQNESFAYSQFAGFPEQKLDKVLFMLV